MGCWLRQGDADTMEMSGEAWEEGGAHVKGLGVGGGELRRPQDPGEIRQAGPGGCGAAEARGGGRQKDGEMKRRENLDGGDLRRLGERSWGRWTESQG